VVGHPQGLIQYQLGQGSFASTQLAAVEQGQSSGNVACRMMNMHRLPVA
jgi:hypothetical protein